MGRKQTNIGEVQRNNTAEYVLSSNYVFPKDNIQQPKQYSRGTGYHESTMTEKHTSFVPKSGLTRLDRKGKEGLSFSKQLLIIDDDPDITLTFKQGLETVSENNEKLFEVYSFNDPIDALSNFEPNFYDLLLIDINMPKMNGFELSKQVLKRDLNVKVCFMSSGQINEEALRENYPMLSIGCFIRKPVEIKELVRKLRAELE
jgi:CheY-like chemotaxis protein